jgi:DNA-binding response OmpR family regulator
MGGRTMPKQPSILLIEDEANLRHNLTVLLEGEGYRVSWMVSR